MGRLSGLCLLVLALGLTACAQAPASSTDIPKASTSIRPQSPAATQQPKSKTQDIPPAIAAVRPRVLLDPTVVVGKTTTEIEQAFGDPNLKREDSPAEVWQYLTRECALHLFFYPAKSSEGRLVVRHIAINGRSVASFSDVDRKHCFNEYLRSVGAEEAFIAKKAS